MAQTGYTPIQLYRTATASAAPTSGNLADGELAINTLDGKLFYKDSSGVVQTIATKGTGPIGGSNTYVQYNNNGALGGSSNFVFDGTNVGIGTSSPGAKLDISVGTTATAINSNNQTDTGFVLKYASALTSLGNNFNQPLAFLTNNTERMRIDSSGNVGIGISPSAWGSGYGVLQMAGPSMWGTTGLGHISVNTYFDGTNYKYINTDAATDYYQLSGTHVWRYAASGTAGTNVTFSEAMRIDTSGNLLVGTTSAFAANTSSIQTAGGGQLTLRNSTSTLGRYWSIGSDSSGSFIVYNNGSTGAYIAYGGTSWTANSDERLKTDLVPIENAASKVSSLRAVTGRYKTDEEGTSRAFLIAQDVQAVLPEAVDATNPDKLGVQYTEVIPLLVAAIKELSAKVTALESR